MATLAWLMTSQTLFLSAVAVVSLLAGSFLNVLVHRLPTILERQWRREACEVLALPHTEDERLNLWLPPSHCPTCEHRLRPWENVPLLSYIALRGRCSHCKTRISPLYPALELTCTLLSFITAYSIGPSLQALFALPLVWCLLALSVIDARHRWLPDVLVLPTLWLGLLLNLNDLFTPLPDAVLGAALGYLSLWSVNFLYHTCTGRQGMGHGDFKLLALLGAWGGWSILPATLTLASLLGASIGLFLLRKRGSTLTTAMPFGPYLAIAGWIVWRWGDEIHPFSLHLSGV